ncbi:MAG: hypothetical protein RMJ17_03935 [Candidatus Aenigmarchaeota archaeon]|nr:hypothetical protein [Candidatus Aenigmarchaeota archaeon]MDW8149710.1 hypothetical protein [Candidatus Aenigmarchaeota archaeon]
MAKCAICKKDLHGVPKNVKKLPESKKKVARKFGGYLCGSCIRKIISEEMFAGVA